MPGTPTTERAFHEEMLRLYRDTREEGYIASLFLQMVTERGGLAAAKKLINDPKPSDGFRRLWEMGRLDLTVEYVAAYSTEYRELFTHEERTSARRRYEEYKRKPA